MALRKEHPWLVTADYELVDAVDKVFCLQAGRRRASLFGRCQSLKSRARVTTCQWVEEVLIANTKVEQVLESGMLAPWDAFCVKLA